MLKILFMVVTVLTTSAFAQTVELETTILTPSQISRIIGPYPKPGSPAETEDFKVMLYYQQHRTAQDCAFAGKDEAVTVEAMFGGEHKILTDAEVNKMSLFLFKAYAGAGVNTSLAKNHFKRPRPYLANRNIKPCISLESSYAYPSGHSLVIRLYARILSEVYPERAELFIKRAEQYGLSRILGGVHHPTDVTSAFVLADYLAEKMIEDKNFMKAMSTL